MSFARSLTSDGPSPRRCRQRWLLLLKTVHILAAVTAVGSNLTYGAWGARGKRDPEHLGFVLRGIKFIDDRIANPAYGLLLLTGLLTGLLMAFLQYSIGTSWILIGLGIFVVAARRDEGG